jgi:hypothetical protein
MVRARSARLSIEFVEWVMQMQRLAWAAFVALTPALAQPGKSPADAQAAKANAAPPAYQSAFGDYRPWREPGSVQWRRANDEAGALGGHVGQLRGHPKEGTTPAPLTPGAKPGAAK